MIEVRDGKSVFSLRAGGILLRSDWVLLQNADAGYILPGGRIELLETAERALAREMWEELRVHVDVIGPGCVFQEIFDYEGQHVHQVLFCDAHLRRFHDGEAGRPRHELVANSFIGGTPIVSPRNQGRNHEAACM
jgi:ADP-ribose pyrophosphatase YjhB (NUDIX family)